MGTSTHSTRFVRSLRAIGLAFAAWTLASSSNVQAQQRVLGLDLASWQGNISQTTWNNLKNIDNRDFVFLRSSRGGTTGFYNQSNPGNNNPPGQNTLSQRYDDHYFVQNITRATAAGMFAGPYHFARPDIIASTLNSGGIANTGTDEADHFMQMAGAWMRPGYLLPVFDLESGDTERTPTQIAQFSIDFSDRIFETYGVRPIMYTNGNYASILQSTSSATEDAVLERFPYLWAARPEFGTNSGNNVPESIATPAVLDPSNNANDTFEPLYGPWDDPPLPEHPWSFWQYKWTLDTVSYPGNLDGNVANGGTEFLKDHLVPALWTSSTGGDWSTLTNWNSGQTPVAPVQGPGQTPRVGPLTLPAVRLPGVDDTVVLGRAAEDISVTLSSGSHNIRKLYVKEALDITGGTLNVNYVPSPDSTPYSVEIEESLSLNGGLLSAHTLKVAADTPLTLNAGTIAFNTLELTRNQLSSSNVTIGSSLIVNPLDGGATVTASGTGNVPAIDLGNDQSIITVNDGTAETDLMISVPLTNGGLLKSGGGRLALNGGIDYSGDTSVVQGELAVFEPTLADDSTVSLFSTGQLELNYLSTDVVGSLFIDGVQQPSGLWGAPGSAAPFTSASIAGPGFLFVADSAAPGDLNGDGSVNASDLALWETAVSQGQPLSGDTDDDLDSDIHDLLQIQRDWTGSPAIASVPEPVSGLLGLVAAACIGWQRRRIAR